MGDESGEMGVWKWECGNGSGEVGVREMGVGRDGSWERWELGEMGVEEMGVEEMGVEEMGVGEMRGGEMRGGEMRVESGEGGVKRRVRE